MQEPEDLSPAENELEAALRGLRPAPCPIDRDRLMFLAGQASARWSESSLSAPAAASSSVISISRDKSRPRCAARRRARELPPKTSPKLKPKKFPRMSSKCS